MDSAYSRLKRLILPLALLISLASCMAGNDLRTDNSPVEPLTNAGLPGLPQLSADEPRSGSVSYNLTIEGNEYYETNAQNGTPGELFLNPGESGPTAWAIYRFSGLSMDVQVDSLAVSMFGLTSGAAYHLALADYAGGRWQILPQQATASVALFDISGNFDAARHLRSDGSLFVAVLVFEASGLVDYLSLDSSGSLAAPTGLQASDARYSQRVAISWDPVAGAQQYQLYSKEAGQGDEFYALLAQLPSGETSFDHTVDNPPSRPAVYGTIYEYRVRAAADGEDPSDYSLPDEGERRIAAPTEMYATDRALSDKVILIWATHPHDFPQPYTYKIYRDGNFIFSLSDNQEVLVGDQDIGVLDYLPHEYYVVDSGPEGDSYPSPVDIGCISGWTEVAAVGVTGPEVGVYSDMEISPDGVTPAVTYVYSDEDRLRYALLDGPSPSESQVGIHGTDMRTALEIDNGVPYILYNDVTEAPAEQGLYMVRGLSGFPDDLQAGWDRQLLHAGKLVGGQVVLEKAGGRLAALFMTEDAADSHVLHYAYATKTGPQGQADWIITTVASYETEYPGFFDLAELNGRPAVATLDDLYTVFLKADVAEPAGNSDWSEVPVPENFASDGSAAGIDLLVHDGVTHVMTALNGDDGNAGVWHMYSTTADPSLVTDWYSTVAYYGVSDTLGPPSMTFIGDQIFAAVASDLLTSAFVGTPYRQGFPYEAIPWYGEFIPNEQDFLYTADEVKLVVDNGSLGCLYSGFRDGDGLFRRLFYQRLTDKGN
ncbi:hypothetical protein KDL29_08000 [bacterium]|nr:hypothetical protein [bacterium]